jgi:hypothetical protein
MRKLALLTTMVIAVMAMTAASASAATQVRNSAGTLCPAVSPAINATNAGFNSTTRNYVSGGCTVHLTGATTVYPANSSSPSVNCNVAFDVHIGPDGWGYADNHVYSGCAGVTACAGDRLIAPRSYTGPGFTVFTYTDAATDLNMEQCGYVAGVNRFSSSSMDIATVAGAWRWTDQYNFSDPYNGFGFYHRGGQFFTQAANALTITH